MDPSLLALLDEIWQAGDANDARETARPRRMLNITPDTGRLLWILARTTRATRILEVGTSNAYSTIWLADAARANGGRVVTLERDPNKVRLARENLAAPASPRGSRCGRGPPPTRWPRSRGRSTSFSLTPTARATASISTSRCLASSRAVSSSPTTSSPIVRSSRTSWRA